MKKLYCEEKLFCEKVREVEIVKEVKGVITCDVSPVAMFSDDYEKAARATSHH